MILCRQTDLVSGFPSIFLLLTLQPLLSGARAVVSVICLWCSSFSRQSRPVSVYQIKELSFLMFSPCLSDDFLIICKVFDKMFERVRSSINLS
jgi:hypothetical protein